jgi:neutral ceramidase
MSEPKNGVSQLRVGAARADITPQMGIQLAGDIGRRRPVEEIRERLYANALVVERDGERFCILSLDVLAMGTDWADRIRQEIARQFGFRPESVLLHVTQNHAAPSVGHLFLVGRRTRFPEGHDWLKGGDDRYNEPTVRACLDAVARAMERREPVTLAVGHGVDGRVAFNRRFVMRDGTTRCHPPVCDPNILHVEGPTDPEVAVATFTNAAGQVVAALLHHSCHPCHGYPHRFVIGDWPGAWVEKMRAHWGGDCIPLVINGCCGNLHHLDHTNPHPLHDHQRMAECLAETTRNILGAMQPVAADAIAVRQARLSLPLRQVPADELAAAERLLREHPEPPWQDESHTSVPWDWVYAIGLLDLEDARCENPVFSYEVQAFRVGDLSVVGLMGEPFVEAQLEIKRMAPTRHTLVAHFCNGYSGYMPTRRAFDGGGYETRTGAGSKLPVDALERVTESAGSLLREVFEGAGRDTTQMTPEA